MAGECERVNAGETMQKAELPLLLRRRDVMALAGISERKFRTVIEAGLLHPLPQRDPRAKRLFDAREVMQVVDAGGV